MSGDVSSEQAESLTKRLRDLLQDADDAGVDVTGIMRYAVPHFYLSWHDDGHHSRHLTRRNGRWEVE